MGPGDYLYDKEGRLKGTILETSIRHEEYGSYQVVYYRPADEWIARDYPRRLNVYRLSDGPDLELGYSNISWFEKDKYSWGLTDDSLHLLEKANKLTKGNDGPFFTMDQIIDNLIKISEEELREAFEGLLQA